MKSLTQTSHIESLFIPEIKDIGTSANLTGKVKKLRAAISNNWDIVKKKGLIKSLLGLAYFAALVVSLIVLLT